MVELIVMLAQELVELIVLVVMVLLQIRQGGIVMEYVELELELDEDVLHGGVTVVVFHIVDHMVDHMVETNCSKMSRSVYLL
jgi:hypothetical protein